MFNRPSTDSSCIVGAYGPKWSSADSRPFVFPQELPSPKSMGYTTYFSSAPMAEVHRVDVFEDRETRLCRGILFEYQNGGSRAVGQCRLGVDVRREYELPLTISFRSIEGGILVRLGECPCTHPREGWECCSLGAGTLYFWFAEKCSALKIA